MLNDLKEYTFWLLRWFTIVYVAIAVLSWTPFFRDDTDPGQYGKRSGLIIQTDSLTGCQYLVSQHGGMTPRVNAQGKHFCNN